MSEPFLGQIASFGFNFPPKNWANCTGQLMSVNQNQALFALLGTFFGGNGTTNFQLPDLRGRTPLGTGTYADGTSYNIGQNGGTETVPILANSMPQHTHTLSANAALGTTALGTGGSLSQTTGGTTQNPFTVPMYVQDNNPSAVLNAAAVGSIGGQPHPNLMPGLVVNFRIALNGVFPSRS